MPQPARWLSWASAVTSTPRHGRADDHALRTYFTNTYNCCMLAGWVRLARGAVRVAAGRRPASSMRLRRAVTCPTCWPSGGGLASSWMPNAERIPQGMRPGKDCGPSDPVRREGGRSIRPSYPYPWFGRSAPCFVDATLQGSDLPYLLQDSFGGACPRKAVGMAPG